MKKSWRRIVGFWGMSVCLSGAAMVPQEAKNWVSPSSDMVFVWIPALKMWVGKYEVTNAEYRVFDKEHKNKIDVPHLAHMRLDGDQQPVVNVSFDDVVQFAQWLTRLDDLRGALPAGYRYRLPTDDEWTVMAYGNAQHPYPWGDTWPPPRAAQINLADEVLSEVSPNHEAYVAHYRDGHAYTVDVNQSGENEIGLYGLAGNVRELTAMNRKNTMPWARRGGSWLSHEKMAFIRDHTDRIYYGKRHGPDTGFRLVLTQGDEADERNLGREKVRVLPSGIEADKTALLDEAKKVMNERYDNVLSHDISLSRTVFMMAETNENSSEDTEKILILELTCIPKETAETRDESEKSKAEKYCVVYSTLDDIPIRVENASAALMANELFTILSVRRKSDAGAHGKEAQPSGPP